MNETEMMNIEILFNKMIMMSHRPVKQLLTGSIQNTCQRDHMNMKTKLFSFKKQNKHILFLTYILHFEMRIFGLFDVFQIMFFFENKFTFPNQDLGLHLGRKSEKHKNFQKSIY